MTTNYWFEARNIRCLKNGYDVVKDLNPFLRPSHVLIDLAKGFTPEGGSISENIVQLLRTENKLNPDVIKINKKPIVHFRIFQKIKLKLKIYLK